jgi:hypothetical protein
MCDTASSFALDAVGLYFDYSKNHISTETMRLLQELYIFYLSVTLPLQHIVECQKQIAVGTLDRRLELSLDLYSARCREFFSNCRKERG